MDKKKIVLSLIGLAALVVPVVLLIIFSNRSSRQPGAAGGERNINPNTVQDVVGKIPTPAPFILPSPNSATDSAILDSEGSPSAQ